jgi:hypothetical protein
LISKNRGAEWIKRELNFIEKKDQPMLLALLAFHSLSFADQPSVQTNQQVPATSHEAAISIEESQTQSAD